MGLIAAADQVVNAGQNLYGVWSGQGPIGEYLRHVCPLPRAGTLRRLSVNVDVNTLNAPASITALVNGGGTALAVLIPAGIPGIFTFDAIIPVAANDAAQLHASTPGSTAGLLRWSASFEYIPT